MTGWLGFVVARLTAIICWPRLMEVFLPDKNVQIGL